MDVNTTIVPTGPPTVATKNHSQIQHHLHDLNQNHHHSHFPSKTILVTIIALISVMVLLSLFLVIFVLRRLRSCSKNATCKEDDNGRALHVTSCRFIASTALNFNSSPDVRGGCLYGGNLSRAPATKFRGVQVFTYKELEVATGGFSEANLIGNGGFGLIYKGVLSDGTLAAIKLLRRGGRQGERAFRIEVSP